MTPSCARRQTAAGLTWPSRGTSADGSVCYVIGVLKAIRARLGKRDGDTIHVVIEPKETKNAAERK